MVRSILTLATQVTGFQAEAHILGFQSWIFLAGGSFLHRLRCHILEVLKRSDRAIATRHPWPPPKISRLQN